MVCVVQNQTKTPSLHTSVHRCDDPKLWREARSFSSYCSWGSWGMNIGVVCHSLLQWTMSCQNSSLWPVRPCTAWLVASLSYVRPFTTTDLWSMKGSWKVREAMANPESVLKSRNLTLPTKARIVEASFFPVVTYGCGSWIIKKAEHQRIDAFELWCWRRLLRVPCTARTSNQSILKEVNPECSLEGLMLKLTLQYFGHLM